MLLGFYSGVSGLIYNEEKLGVTSSNLSNVDTAGFRRSLLVMRSRDQNPDTKWIHSDVRGRIPKFYGIRRTGVYKIYKDTGTLKQTDNPFDVAIPPELKNAFFQVKKEGSEDPEIYYTRNGTLSMGPLDPNVPGSPIVLKMSGHVALDAGKQPIEIDPTGGALEVGKNGLIRQGELIIGELPVYRLNKSSDPTVQKAANLQRLSQLGDSLYQVPRELKDEFHPFRLEIGENGVQRLTIQGMQEGSNVNPVGELLHMMEASKAHSSNVSAMTTQAEGLTKLFTLVRT